MSKTTGILAGLGAIVDGLGELAEALEAARERADDTRDADDPRDADDTGAPGTVHRSGGREGLRWDVRVRTGLGGARGSDESDGGLPFSAARPRPADHRRAPVQTAEPIRAEVHDDDDDWLILADLPGVAVGELAVTVAGDVVQLRTATDGPAREGELLLPGPATGPARISRNNGILCVRLAKAGGTP